MNLNKEQIEKVIDWMNTWEQLKNTAIPLRFKEEFTKQLTLTDVVSMCCDETRKVNQFLKRPSKYCMTCSKELN